MGKSCANHAQPKRIKRYYFSICGTSFNAENGWTFEDGPGVVKDPIHNAKYMHEIYTHVEPEYSGRVTVPVLYDKKTDKIVNNESSEIMRMFNSAFEGLESNDYDFAPEELLDEIDEMNDFVYDTINNGVYKSGFATEQDVYEEEVTKLFDALDKLEAHLETNEYLVGGKNYRSRLALVHNTRTIWPCLSRSLQM